MKLILSSLFVFLFAVTSMAQVVATVGKKKITLKEFKTKYRQSQELLNPPTAEQFLEDLIRFEVGLMEAKKKKVENSPEVQEAIRHQIYGYYIEKEIGSKVKDITITEKEMRKQYKKTPELRTSHIVINIKLNATKKERAIAKKRAQEIYSIVKKSKRAFKKLVNLYSDDTFTKAAGGDLGYQSMVTALPDYYNTALKMKIGQIKGLVETKYGFHILKLTGRRKFKDADRRQIKSIVFELKRKKIFDQLFSKTKRKYKVSKNKKLIRNL
ncbi:MAG: hypothetical protein HOO06_00795 [Bdellovibrionaceae bacterium]|nr:hypothetical protein [Pseudobdellovibrionaceae bacterium]